VPVSPVLTVDEALADPQTRARGMVRTLEHPTLGTLPVVASPFGPAATSTTPPPRVGAHTAALLREQLGLSEAEMATLVRDGVVGVVA
jgi:crotonobetainyl-CoA:carnitine CoA-transferase CaiB-like acyl-CoA transferase